MQPSNHVRRVENGFVWRSEIGFVRRSEIGFVSRRVWLRLAPEFGFVLRRDWLRSARRVWLRFAWSPTTFRVKIGFVRRWEIGVASLDHLKGSGLKMASFGAAVWLRFGSKVWLCLARRFGFVSRQDWLRLARRFGFVRPSEFGFVRRGGLGSFRSKIGFVWRGGLASFRDESVGRTASRMVRLRGLDAPYKISHYNDTILGVIHVRTVATCDITPTILNDFRQTLGQGTNETRLSIIHHELCFVN